VESGRLENDIGKQKEKKRKENTCTFVECKNKSHRRKRKDRKYRNTKETKKNKKTKDEG
jgi:hypothetical protein